MRDAMTLGPRKLFVSDSLQEMELLVTYELSEPELDADSDENTYWFEGRAYAKCDWFEVSVPAVAEDDIQLVTRLTWLLGIAINQACLRMNLRCRSFVDRALGQFGDMEGDLFR